MRHALTLDATALQALESVYEKSIKQETLLLLSGVHSQPLMVMQRSGFLDRIGSDNVLGNIDDSLNRAREFLGLPLAPPPQPFTPTVTREKA